MLLKKAFKYIWLFIFLQTNQCLLSLPAANKVHSFDKVFLDHLEAFCGWQRFKKYPEIFRLIVDLKNNRKNENDFQVLNWRVFQDLSLLNGDEFSKEVSIIRLLPEQPKTLFGYVQMAEFMASPLHTKDDLEARKQFIETVFEDKKFNAQGFIDQYLKNHDTCLDFIYKDHCKDENSCLNPSRLFFWTPISKSGGIRHSIAKTFVKFFKLGKLGIKADSLIKNGSKAKAERNFFPKLTGAEGMDSFWIFLSIRWSFWILLMSWAWVEDLQSIIEKLDNIYEIPILRSIRKKLVNNPYESGASPRMARTGSGNLCFDTRLNGGYWEYFNPVFRAELERCYDDFMENIGRKKPVNKPLAINPIFAQTSGLKLAKKASSPIRTFIRAIQFVVILRTEINFWTSMTRNMRTDFSAICSLLDNFFKFAKVVTKAVDDGELVLDSHFKSQFFRVASNENLIALHKKLKDYRFSLKNLPLALRNYKLLYFAKRDLAEMMEVYASLEVFMCANKLAKDPNFCRPSFVQKSHSSIEFDGLWSLYLGAEDSVKTKFGLGESVYSSVVTGSNAGGKSFFMRNVLTALVLAQTLVVAPCSFLEFTPFSSLYSYIKKEDDPVNKISLHWSECAQVAEFQDMVRLFDKDKFIFTIMDELFSGAPSDKGAELFSRFMNFVKTRHNVLGIYTTHSTKSLDEFKFFDDSLIKFCKFGVNRDSSGNFISYKYFPEDGVAGEYENTAMDVARMAGMI